MDYRQLIGTGSNATDNPDSGEGEQDDGNIEAFASLPIFPADERAPLLAGAGRGSSGYRSVGIHSSKSFSNSEGIHHYTSENRPQRRPFHLSPERRLRSEEDSHLYARFRYYSRLRAPAESNDDALVIPDHVVPVELFSFYIPAKLRDSDGKQQSYVTIASIWNTMMGTSLLTMPWAVREAGLIGGLIIMVLEGGVCLYTACLLLNLQKTMGLQGQVHEISYLFRTLWRGSLGKAIEGISFTFSVVTLLGALVVYWVLMSNFMYNTGEAIYQYASGLTDQNSTDSVGVICPPNITHSTVVLPAPPPDDLFHKFWTLNLTVPILLVIPFIFLLSIKNTAIFSYFNSFGAISVLAIYVFVVVKAASWGFNFDLYDPSDPFYVPMYQSSFMALSGTLSLAYFIHNCVITLMKTNKHQENNIRDISIAYVLVALTYIPVGIIFYLTFPLPKFCLVDNFLDNFPPHHITLAIARLFLLFQMLTVFPLLTYFLRSQIVSYFLGPDGTFGAKPIMAINAVVVSLSVMVAIFYPNIGFLLRWVGAISGLAYIFVLPAASDLQARYNKGNLSWCRTSFAIILMAMGVANFVAQFFL